MTRGEVPFNLIDICLKSGGVIAIGGFFVTPVEVDFVLVAIVFVLFGCNQGLTRLL
tara:strand:- start:18 stop:185 length:168 start_codon:yes stop_codon:yes gene_type:complete